jgi:hypothetical protein
MGRTYPWPRPRKSPCCGGVRLWRHGFVARYFDDYPNALLMLRYRCPDCGAVHTLRPADYDRRFRAPWLSIFRVLLIKILINRWSFEFSKERQRYWMNGFGLHASRRGNVAGIIDHLKALGELTTHVVLGTHSTRFYEMRPLRDPPHRIFRLTIQSGSGVH